MINFGSTGDIIVAAMLAIGQLIEPVPEANVAKAVAAYESRNSCQQAEKMQAKYEKQNCLEVAEFFKKNKRKKGEKREKLSKKEKKAFRKLKRKYRKRQKKCEVLSAKKSRFEVVCKTDKINPKVLKYKPKSISEFKSMSNYELLQELQKICFAAQDRALLKKEEWSKGKVADRNGIEQLGSLLELGGLDKKVKAIAEAEDGLFKLPVARQVVESICDWNKNLKEVSEKIDFRRSFGYIDKLLKELPNVQKLPVLKEADIIFDGKGNVLNTVSNNKDYVMRDGKPYVLRNNRRRVVEPHQIPDLVFKTFVSIEDHRFFEHNGLDFQALVGAMMSSEKRGASTFTMQLIKNAFFLRDVEGERKRKGKRSLKRKIKELLMIPMVEKNYTKKEILTYYLNVIGLTSATEGIKLAASELFGVTKLSELKLEHIALLAALPKGPSVYNPRRFPKRAKERRNEVLMKMAKQGLVSKEESQNAQSQPLGIQNLNRRNKNLVLSKYFIGHMKNHFDSLKEKKVRDSRWNLGGLDIKTSFDPDLQEVVVKALHKGLLSYEKSTPRSEGSERDRYNWKPWVDYRSILQKNIRKQVKANKGDWEAVFKKMEIKNPYKNKGWVPALRVRAKNKNGVWTSYWGLQNGEKAEVLRRDEKFYESLARFDVIFLERKKSKYSDKTYYQSINRNIADALNVNGRNKYGGDWKKALPTLKKDHPYPETDWVIGLRLPRKENRWGLVDGSTARIIEYDKPLYNGLKPYDVVLLKPFKVDEQGPTLHRLAAPPQVEGAVIAMDIHTGNVLALQGGFSAGSQGVGARNNRATRSYRQPGSTIKPFTYLYGLMNGVQPHDILSNHGVRFPKITNCPHRWTPKNYSDRMGMNIPVRRALENSVNRALMNMFLGLTGLESNHSGFTDYGRANKVISTQIKKKLYDIYDLTSRFGAYPSRRKLRRIKGKRPPCLPFLLGAYETTPLKMAAAYTTIANGGLYRKPVFLKEVQKGMVPLVVDESSQLRAQIHQYRTALKAGTMHVPEAFGVVDGVDPQSMTQLRSLLQGVVQRGTAVGMKKWAKWVGGKTGTTNNNHDAWFAGFNNDIAVIVWVGYDSDYFYKSLGDKRTGGSVAMPIFREIMQSYYRMNPDKLDSTLPDPTETPGIVSAEIEPYTGYIFSDAFKNSCHDMQRRYKVRRHVRTIKEYFVEGSKWNDSKYLFKNQKKSYVAREFLYNNICTPWRQR